MTRDPHIALRNALIAYLGPLTFVECRTWHWASITFEGMRHELGFSLPWSAETEALLDAMPDVELPMTGSFVASIVPAHRTRNGDLLTVRVEALTIAEA